MRQQMAQDGSLPQFELQIKENKCIEKLLESAKITEVKPKKTKTKSKKTASSEKKQSRKKKTAAKKKTNQ